MPTKAFTGGEPVDWAYLAMFVLSGLALDWAFFEKMRNQVEVFRPMKDGFRYRDLLFPRAFVTALSALIVGVGALEAPPHTWLIILGGDLFLLSHFYAHYKIWRFGRGR